MAIHFSTTEFECLSRPEAARIRLLGLLLRRNQERLVRSQRLRLRRREEGRARGSQAPQLRRGLRRPLIDHEAKRGLS